MNTKTTKFLLIILLISLFNNSQSLYNLPRPYNNKAKDIASPIIIKKAVEKKFPKLKYCDNYWFNGVGITVFCNNLNYHLDISDLRNINNNNNNINKSIPQKENIHSYDGGEIAGDSNYTYEQYILNIINVFKNLNPIFNILDTKTEEQKQPEIERQRQAEIERQRQEEERNSRTETGAS